MLETLASHLEVIAGYAPVWGFVLIVVFMEWAGYHDSRITFFNIPKEDIPPF